MRILKIICCLSIIGCSSSTSLIETSPAIQEDVFINIENIEEFYIDKLDNHYTLSTSGVLRRYDDQGRFKYEYSNRFYGSADHVDVSNPQKILVFYRDFQKIMILDNTLSEFSRIDAEAFGEMGELSAVCTSNDNHIWVYDISNATLHKINFSGTIISSSNPLNITIGVNPEYHFLIQDEQTILAHNTNYGSDLFDQLANYKNHLSFTQNQEAFLKGGNIYFIKDQTLKFATLEDYFLKEMPLPPSIKNSNSVRLHDEYFYFLTPSGLDRMKTSN